MRVLPRHVVRLREAGPQFTKYKRALPGHQDWPAARVPSARPRREVYAERVPAARPRRKPADAFRRKLENEDQDEAVFNDGALSAMDLEVHAPEL